MSLWNPTGRERWKAIKSIAATGPIRAYMRWSERKGRADKMASFNAPECLLEHYRRMEHDAAVAVRLSMPSHAEADSIAEPTTDRMLYVASQCNITPTEAHENILEVAVKLRAGMEAKGYPMPRHKAATLELLRHIMRKATP